MERGRLDLPLDADPGVFILSDGKLNNKPTTEQRNTIRELLTLYQKSLPKDSKASTTIKTEDTHISHLLKHLRASKLAQAVTAVDPFALLGMGVVSLLTFAWRRHGANSGSR